MSTPRKPTVRGDIASRAANGLVDSVERVARRPYSPGQIVAIIRLAVHCAITGQIDRMSAALAYRTIFSLIPMLVIGLAVVGAFATKEQVAEVVTKFVDLTGLGQIAIEDPAPPLPHLDLQGPSPEAAPPEPSEVTAQRARVDEWINHAFERMRSINFKTIGVLGLLVLIYAAVSMLVEVERACNQIYRAPTGRSWIRRLVHYWAILTLGGVLIFISFSVAEFARSWVDEQWKTHWLSGVRDSMLTVVAFAITVLVSTTLLLVIYVSVPNTRVRFGPALAGALFAAIMWEAGKWGFTRYLHYSANYARFYGSLAILPLFLLWIYVTWMIILLGLELAYAIQTYRSAVEVVRTDARRGLRAAAALLGLEPENRPEPVVVEPAAILAIMALIAERFAAGQPGTLLVLAQRTGLSEVVIASMLDRLVKAGFVRRVEGESEPSYVPSRPPDAIKAADVLSAAEEIAARVEGSGFGGVIRAVSHAQAEALRNRTIADLIREGGLAPPAGPPGARPITASTPAPPPQPASPTQPAPG